MQTLKRSKDRKVANSVTKSGNPNIANSFGLPSGREYSCQDQTDFCEAICYAGKLEKIYKGVRTNLLHNWDLVKDADFDLLVDLLDDMIEKFVADCYKREADKIFRIHWDGDFFSNDYTRAWSKVIADNPSVQFWVYTRSLPSAMTLHYANHDNLALYFSADEDNLHFAKIAESKGILIAFVGKTFADGKDIFPKATKCPENNKSIPLISEKGSACKVCGLCVSGRKSVLFSTTKK
jgi:hypothetical protein